MSRALVWDGCVNVRDVGGLPTEDGRLVRTGALVRADSLANLTDAGWQALLADGVRRVVDLRWPAELDERGYEAPIEVVHVSLLGDAPSDEYMLDFHERSAAFESGADVLATHYVDMLEHRSGELARVAAAVADAPEGAVCVHCAGGKDRTGVVVALLLRAVGVPAARIAEDYALSADNLRTRWDAQAWADEADDPRERRWRLVLATTPAEAMLRTLDELDRRWGGAWAYLRAAGVGDSQLERLRERLVAA